MPGDWLSVVWETALTPRRERIFILTGSCDLSDSVRVTTLQDADISNKENEVSRINALEVVMILFINILCGHWNYSAS